MPPQSEMASNPPRLSPPEPPSLFGRSETSIMTCSLFFPFPSQTTWGIGGYSTPVSLTGQIDADYHWSVDEAWFQSPYCCFVSMAGKSSTPAWSRKILSFCLSGHKHWSSSWVVFGSVPLQQFEECVASVTSFQLSATPPFMLWQAAALPMKKLGLHSSTSLGAHVVTMRVHSENESLLCLCLVTSSVKVSPRRTWRPASRPRGSHCNN